MSTKVKHSCTMRGKVACADEDHAILSLVEKVEKGKAPDPRSGDDRRAPSVEQPDMVNHPRHYGDGVHEVWNCLDAWQRGRLIQDAHLWQAAKYIARAGAKGDELEDLKKARVYLDRAIARREKKS